MVAYSFKKRFIEPILLGTKDQTMRSPRRGRSRHARAGEEVQLYYAQRTIHCRRLGCPPCILVTTVQLRMTHSPSIMVGGTFERDIDGFAIRDGFTDFDDLCRFWWDEHETRRWRGDLIRWDRRHFLDQVAA